ncbi:MAG: CO dehydrogenase/acetyl-CoA synthase complex subunit epsilon [Candidatus Nezhaarchaeales archaeon]
MMAAVTPWQWGNVPGPRTANVLRPEVAGKMIKAAKRPLLIVGGALLEWRFNGRPLIDFALELGKRGIPIVATSNTLKAFLEKGFDKVLVMSLVDVVNRLQDPKWSLDGKGPYTHVIFLGISYQFESQVLSTLKNFAPHLITISLDRFYHPNASFSFNNLSEKEWGEALNEVLKTI